MNAQNFVAFLQIFLANLRHKAYYTTELVFCVAILATLLYKTTKNKLYNKFVDVSK